MTPTDLSKAAGISVPYASQLLSTKDDQRREPSQSLAIHIFRKTGLKFGPVAKLTDEEIDLLERLQERAA